LTNDSLLHQAITRARRRRFVGLLLSDAGMALAVVAAIFSALLLAGVQVLSLGAVLLLTLLGAALLVWRLRSQWISLYETAQAVDRAYGLPDTVSTAWFFSQSGALSELRQEHLEPLIERQCNEAVYALAANSASDAFPLQLSKVHLAALVVCGVAFSLFGYRYMQSESLDLSDQLATLRIPFISDDGEAPPMMSDDERYRPESETKRSPLEDYNPPYDPSRERLDGTYNDMPPITGVSVSDPETMQNGDSTSSPGDSATDMRSQLAADPRRQQDKGNSQGKNREGESKQSKDGNSLLDKFQQAMNSMMDKLSNKNNESMEQRGERQERQDSQSGGDQAGDGSDDSSDREGNQRNENPQGSENSKEGLGGQQAQDTGKQDNAGANESPSDAPSSVGAEDGAKDLAAARQMEAMGQIAEILGQRSEQVKGEMKVEVEAQKEQSLTTALKSVRASHSDTGGEINRDSVPLRLHNYVKEYLKAAREAEAAPREGVRNR